MPIASVEDPFNAAEIPRIPQTLSKTANELLKFSRIVTVEPEP